MARHIWSVVCQVILTDQFMNSVSYIQAIESLSGVTLPVTVPQIMVGTSWVREGESVVISRLRVLAPDQTVIRTIDAEPGRFGANTRLRQSHFIVGFQFPVTGTYEFVVEQRLGAEWRPEARIPIDIQIASAAALQTELERRAAAATTV